MKRILLWACVFLGTTTSMAQEMEDFDAFMKKESMSFYDFLDAASRDFLNFMREPWKELHSEEPLVQKEEPEPIRPTLYDEKDNPADRKPVQLTIEEILDLTTTEGGQTPKIKSTDVDVIDFGNPVCPANPQGKPSSTHPKNPEVVEKPTTKGEQPQGTAPQPKQDRPQGQNPRGKNVVPPSGKAGKPKTECPFSQSPQGGRPTPPSGTTKRPTAPTNTPTDPFGVPKETPETPDSTPALTQDGPGKTAVLYGGTRYYISASFKGKCRLSGLTENHVADAYEQLYKADYANVVQELQSIKEGLALNDWGMYTFVKSFTDACTTNHNESIVMQHFLLSQLGYKAKMARKGDGSTLMLFLSSDCMIYGHPYITLEGLNYYYLQKDATACPFYMYAQNAPQAKGPISMKINSVPKLKGSTTHTTHQATGSHVKVETDVPKALMNFYSSYPQCDFEVYVKAPVNPAMADQILTPLRNLVKGKSEEEAANLLINFVQTGFDYATDGEQFGYEKPFFVEELFYYPSCDCEDRSILFSYLVRNILGLEVVLLDYPNHIATAVQFKNDVRGDYLMIDGKKYTVCDPTYIGASIGMTMPQYKTVKAKVLKY